VPSEAVALISVIPSSERSSCSMGRISNRSASSGLTLQGHGDIDHGNGNIRVGFLGDVLEGHYAAGDQKQQCQDGGSGPIQRGVDELTHGGLALAASIGWNRHHVFASSNKTGAPRDQLNPQGQRPPGTRHYPY